MADQETSERAAIAANVPPAFGTSYLFSIRAQITRLAVAAGIAPLTLAGLAMQESSGDPFAVSVDMGWARRHWPGILRALRASPSRRDDSWAAQSFWFDLGIGLCQVHLIVAIELGVPLRSPAQLFDVETNLTAASLALAGHMRRTRGDERRALLAYNGGADLGYPSKVDRRKRDLLANGW